MNDDQEPEAMTVPLLRRTPRNEVCEALHGETTDVRDAVDSLTFGIRELDLPDDHELYLELAKARAALDHIASLLDTETVRGGRSFA
jgi:hypothetical protein